MDVGKGCWGSFHWEKGKAVLFWELSSYIEAHVIKELNQRKNFILGEEVPLTVWERVVGYTESSFLHLGTQVKAKVPEWDQCQS